MDDEKILSARQQKRMAEQQQEENKEKEKQLEGEIEMSIYDGIIDIDGVPTEFRRRMLMDDKISIYMPVGFEEMSPEAIASIYFVGNPPQCVYTDAVSEFSVGFTMTEHGVADEHMWDFPIAFRSMLSKMTPGGVKILDTLKWEYQIYRMAGIEFISQSLYEAVYNLMFFSSVQGKLVIGFINFPAKHRKRLTPLVQEMARSYQIHAEAEMLGEEAGVSGADVQSEQLTSQ